MNAGMTGRALEQRAQTLKLGRVKWQLLGARQQI